MPHLCHLMVPPLVQNCPRVVAVVVTAVRLAFVADPADSVESALVGPDVPPVLSDALLLSCVPRSPRVAASGGSPRIRNNMPLLCISPLGVLSVHTIRTQTVSSVSSLLRSEVKFLFPSDHLGPSEMVCVSHPPLGGGKVPGSGPHRVPPLG